MKSDGRVPVAIVGGGASGTILAAQLARRGVDCALIDGSDRNGLNGAAGELRRVVADIGDGKVMTLTGPFSFDEQGFLSGKFKLEIEQLGPWGDSLKQAFPDIASTVNTATKLLKSLAGGSNKVSVDLVVDRGHATVSGFIPLGRIPPI